MRRARALDGTVTSSREATALDSSRIIDPVRPSEAGSAAPESSAGSRDGEPPSAGALAARAAENAREERVLEVAALERRARADEARREADDRLKREMDALVEAKHALGQDPRRALLLARRGQVEFRNGTFGEERQHILILALIALGRVDEARRIAAPYLAAHPRSPFARRVRNALDTVPRTTP